MTSISALFFDEASPLLIVFLPFATLHIFPDILWNSLGLLQDFWFLCFFLLFRSDFSLQLFESNVKIIYLITILTVFLLLLAIFIELN